MSMNSFDDLLNNAPTAEQQGSAKLSKEEYATKKQTEREAVFKRLDIAAMEVASNGDAFRQYLNVQSSFDRYSAANALLIMAQNPEATRLGDFDHWKGKGGYVNKGETSIAILEPHSYTKEDGSPGTGYNLKKVFDISQVDTRKMKPTAPPPKYTDRQLLQALISKAPMKIAGVDTLPEGIGAQSNHETGTIFVRRGMPFHDSFRSIAQELCYAEIMRSDKDSLLDPQFSAYCAAYILCKKNGVDTHGFDFSEVPDVLAGLNAQAVKGELSQIRDIVGRISERMAKQLDAVSKAAKSQDAR